LSGCHGKAIAYGHARRAIERERIGPNAPGRDPREMLRRMIEQVGRECEHRDMEAIEEGVKDAVEGRQPRW
jgi:hypothetical protein